MRPAALLVLLAACAVPPAEPPRAPFPAATVTPPPPSPLPAGLTAALAAGDAAFRAERWAEAIAAYETVLALRPEESVTVHRQIGLAAVRMDDHARALDHLARVLETDPADDAIRARMAQSAIASGEIGRALALLRDLPATAAPDLLYEVAVHFVNADEPEHAIAYLGRVLAADGRHRDALFRRAMAHLQLRRMAEARADLRRFLELEPDGPRRESARRALDQLR